MKRYTLVLRAFEGDQGIAISSDTLTFVYVGPTFKITPAGGIVFDRERMVGRPIRVNPLLTMIDLRAGDTLDIELEN